MDRALKILVICDPQLKDRIEAILDETSDDIRVIYWQRGWGKHTIKELWHEKQHWDVVFSVYSDYILPPHALRRITIPLNIHPALPAYPGVGFDVYPLIHNKHQCGATLHWMENTCDHGVVLDSKSMPLPANSTYPEIRAINQSATLSLFERWFGRLIQHSRQDFLKYIHVPVKQGRGWSGPYVSWQSRHAQLVAFKNRFPEKWNQLKIPESLFNRQTAIPAKILSPK
ncbi:MAG: formyltransferase family protein [Opitutaceae bacterium]